MVSLRDYDSGKLCVVIHDDREYHAVIVRSWFGSSKLILGYSPENPNEIYEFCNQSVDSFTSTWQDPIEKLDDLGSINDHYNLPRFLSEKKVPAPVKEERFVRDVYNIP